MPVQLCGPTHEKVLSFVKPEQPVDFAREAYPCARRDLARLSHRRSKPQWSVAAKVQPISFPFNPHCFSKPARPTGEIDETLSVSPVSHQIDPLDWLDRSQQNAGANAGHLS